MPDIVSCAEFWNVSYVLNAAVAHAPAARWIDGRVIKGELRGLLPSGVGDQIDARDRLVRFTDTMGFEYSWTVGELAADFADNVKFARTDGVVQ